MSVLTDYLQEEAGKKKKSAASWTEDTLKNAEKCTWCTHVGKFVHPSVENVAVFVPHNISSQDGAVYTENTVCETDIAVSANYLATAKLLSLELEDGKNVLTHFKNDSVTLRQDLMSLGVDYEKVKEQVLKTKENTVPTDTDDRLRQVYFPINDSDYHLLSILPSSSLMMAVRKRIQEMDQKARLARDNKSETYGEKHQRIFNVTCIGIGGTKPQNISYLNNKYGGKTYMFMSVPPNIEKRDVSRPKKDFFRETLPWWQFRELFRLLRSSYAREQNNMEARQNARTAEEHIIDKILTLADCLKSLPEGWSDDKKVSLPEAQKVWLDEKYVSQRAEETEWKQEIADSMARWILRTYEIITKEKTFGDTEIVALRKEIIKAL